MTPLPKRKYPKTGQRKRRSHLAMRMPHVVECPNCQSPRLAHHTCPICGTYRGREVLPVEVEELEA